MFADSTIPACLIYYYVRQISMQPNTLCPHMYACAHPWRCINAIALMWSMLAAHPHRASWASISSNLLYSTALGPQLVNSFLLLSFCPWTQGWAFIVCMFWSSWAPVLFCFYADSLDNTLVDKFQCFSEHVLLWWATAQIFLSCSFVFKVTYEVQLTVTLCCTKCVVSVISCWFPKEEPY